MYWGSFIAAPIKLEDSQNLMDELIPNIGIPMQVSPVDYLHMTLSYIGWLDEKEALGLAARISRLTFPRTTATSGRLRSLCGGGESAYLAIELVLTPKLKSQRDKYLREIHGDADYFGNNWLPHISIGRITASNSLCIESSLIPSYINLESPCLFKSIDQAERIGK